MGQERQHWVRMAGSWHRPSRRRVSQKPKDRRSRSQPAGTGQEAGRGGPSRWSLDAAVGRPPLPGSLGSNCRWPCPACPRRSLGNWPGYTPLSRGKALGPTSTTLTNSSLPPLSIPPDPLQPPRSASASASASGRGPGRAGGPGLSPHNPGLRSRDGGRLQLAALPPRAYRSYLGKHFASSLLALLPLPRTAPSCPAHARGRPGGGEKERPCPAEGRR